jgi:hypothetical protein
MVGKEVRPYKQRLQAKQNELITAITRTGLDGRAFSPTGAQDLADRASHTYVLQQSNHERAILGQRAPMSRRPNTGVSLLE